MTNVFVRLWAWSLSNHWTNALSHFVLAFAGSFVVGPWAMAVFYTLNEVQDIMVEAGFHGVAAVKANALDHALDALSGMAGAATMYVLVGRGLLA